jgi:hypothetical protein
MRSIVFTIAIIWIAINGKAQVHSIGIQGGLNFTNISAKDVFENTDNRTGFIGGLKYEFLVSQKYSLGADIFYSQQGFLDGMILKDETGNPTGESAELKFYYDYLALPMKFGYTFGKKLKITPKIGMQPSFLISAKTTLPKFSDTGDLTGEETIDVKENVSKFDLAGLIEIEFGYGISQNIDLFTSVIGKYSLTTFSNSDYFDQGKLRHISLAISIGVKYKLTKN